MLRNFLRLVSVSRKERFLVLRLYVYIAALHLLGWSLYIRFTSTSTLLLGLGPLAYALGLRLGVDADHIAAIDDTVRYSMRTGSRDLAVGFFFSLGHACIVFVMGLAAMAAAPTLIRHLFFLQRSGATAATISCGAFLCFIGLLNLMLLFCQVRRGSSLADPPDRLVAGARPASWYAFPL